MNSPPGRAADPAAPAAPTYTAAQAAQQAWSTQPLASARVGIQPVGNVTLTGLPTYFRAMFPATGLAPGETQTVTLLGHTITLRTSDVRYVYDFGDGARLGPTGDAGGTYPDGGVTHTYQRKGYVTTRIDTIITGQFQENGGPWTTIGTTTVPGTPQRLEIDALESRLTP